MKMNYEKPEVSFVSFAAEEIMSGGVPRMSLETWGVTTSFSTGREIIEDD